MRSEQYRAWRKRYDQGRKRSGKRVKPRKREREPVTIIGIDGEGYDLEDGSHVYVYLCAVNEHGKMLAEAFDPNGLSHDECMQTLLALPKRSTKFGFSFGYDLTMMLKNLPRDLLYLLYRPGLRTFRIEKRAIRKPVSANGYRYDWMNGSFTVAEEVDGKKRRTHVWDCFKFFQTSFVDALDLWKIGTEDERDDIRRMKNLRGSFATEDIENVKRYCQKECYLLALLMRDLIEAHKAADLDLCRYDGVGSTATVLLKKHDVAEHRGIYSGELELAVHRAFFGGRFENSTVGIVETPVYVYDIANAYPYAETFLPCFACGSWHYTEREEEVTGYALVDFRMHELGEVDDAMNAWLPLPYRDPKGSIAYPTNFYGTAWLPEYLAARRFLPHPLEFRGAWVYTPACNHQPFSFLPDLYRERIRWGKEGRGIVLKLGGNATYGKTAQTIGIDPPFRDLAWAGMTTATTRAMLLDAISTAVNPWDILAVATDGIVSTVPLKLAKPRDTGTFDLPKPLGSWEEKVIGEGMFLAKPGVYFRLRNATLADMRARGLGRREMLEQREKLVQGFEAWNKRDPDYFVSIHSRRFFGARYSVYGGSVCRKCGAKSQGYRFQCEGCGGRALTFDVKEHTQPNGEPVMGRWLTRESRVRFDPRPKRERVIAQPGKHCLLGTRNMQGAISTPYQRGLTSPEGDERRKLREFLSEQPDED